MAYKMKGFSGFKGSPAKQTKFPNSEASKSVKRESKKPPRDPEKPFTQEELLKGLGGVRTKKSPAKQEGPQTKKNVDLMKGEMEGTWVDKSTDKASRIIDYEERASFLNENDIPDLEGSKDPKDIAKLKQLKKTAKNLQHEADIIRNRKPAKKK